MYTIVTILKVSEKWTILISTFLKSVAWDFHTPCSIFPVLAWRMAQVPAIQHKYLFPYKNGTITSLLRFQSGLCRDMNNLVWDSSWRAVCRGWSSIWSTVAFVRPGARSHSPLLFRSQNNAPPTPHNTLDLDISFSSCIMITLQK